MAKLLYRYQTYYPEKHIPNNDTQILNCPTCNKIRFGKAQLTKRRKTTDTCSPLYWIELTQHKHCPNCDSYFETELDIENHTRYHCGNPDSLFQNNLRDGKIDRRTHHGFGIPPEDIQLFHKMILFGKCTLTWNCLICKYQSNRNNWHQVYGHVRAEHCYKSREPNERWNIPIHEQNKTKEKKQNARN